MKMTSTGKADLHRDIDFKRNEIEMARERKEADFVKEKKIEKKSEIEKTENKKTDKIDEKELDKILEKLNVDNNSIRFEKNYDYDRIVVQIVNKDTGELVKQLPAEHVLEFNRLYQEFTGMLFDITV